MCFNLRSEKKKTFEINALFTKQWREMCGSVFAMAGVKKKAKVVKKKITRLEQLQLKAAVVLLCSFQLVPGLAFELVANMLLLLSLLLFCWAVSLTHY